MSHRTCQTTFALVLVTAALLAAPAAGQSGNLAWLSPTLGQMKTQVSYETGYTCQQEVKEQPESLSMVDHRLRFLVPVFLDDRAEVALTGRADMMQLVNTQVVLPDANERLDLQWYDIRFGVLFREKLENDWLWGFQAEIGSASNHPFSSIKEFNGTVNAFLRIPHGPTNAWVIMLNWTGDRSFLEWIPLPGAGYYFELGQQFQMLAGFPMSSLTWKPIEPLTIEASYFFIRNVKAEARYRVAPPVEVYAGFEWTHRTWRRTDRNDDQFRLFYYEKNVKLGLRWFVSKNIYVDAFGGYAWQRFFFEEENYDDNDINRINLEPGTFAGVKIGFVF